MAKLQDTERHVEKPAQETRNEPVLKGAFASVMLLGLFLVISWVGVFLLFLARG
ncbi:cytochrome c oxidase subunit 2A [Paenibacillus filicis]|uniref:Cytochrome c oxidase subunit 2A n=1 Tax=Paenibacillus filicis TaxID=669464 RepID=A0ABU9DFB9_9BACL